MARLDDIPKRPFFQTPNGYFDKLPAKIQSRMEGDVRPSPANFVIRYALPAMVIVAAVLYYGNRDPDAEAILASVETEQLIEYVHESDMSTDEVLEIVELTPGELDSLEHVVFELAFFDDTETFESN